jgi:hypothetical protein
MKVLIILLICCIFFGNIFNISLHKVKRKENSFNKSNIDSHNQENEELYEFHKVDKKKNIEDIQHHYKDITEENYERNDMGYSDYTPINLRRL